MPETPNKIGFFFRFEHIESVRWAYFVYESCNYERNTSIWLIGLIFVFDDR
jgi:hypothetical protein